MLHKSHTRWVTAWHCCMVMLGSMGRMGSAGGMGAHTGGVHVVDAECLGSVGRNRVKKGLRLWGAWGHGRLG